MDSIIRLTFVAMGVVFYLGLNGANRACALDTLGAHAVWTYFNFDGMAQPLLPAEPFRQVTTIGRDDARLRYVDGRIGQALSLTPDGRFVSVTHGRTDFPTATGSLIIWFKPNLPMGETGRLLDGAWALSVTIPRARLMASDGEWTVTVSEMLSGRRAATRFTSN